MEYALENLSLSRLLEASTFDISNLFACSAATSALPFDRGSKLKIFDA